VAGYEERADDGGVDEDGDGEADTELLDGEDLPAAKPAKTMSMTMRSAAEVMMRPLRCRPTATARFR
jgi:hypothetical protein